MVDTGSAVMPNFLITAPDGKKYRITSPDGTSQQDALEYFRKNYSGPHKFSVDDIKNIAAQSANKDTNTAGQHFMAGVGEQFVNIGRGAEQLGLEAASKLGSKKAAEAEQNLQQRINEEAPIQKQIGSTLAGKAGDVVGNVAIAAPTAFIPGAATLPGAIATGASLGAVQPTQTGESRVKNVEEGALGGAAGFGLGAAVGAAGKAAGRYLSKEAADRALLGTHLNAVSLAKKYGIRITPSMAGGAPMGDLAEAASGVPNLQKGAIRINNKIVDEVAKKEIGLNPKQPITESALKDAEKAPAEIYRKVEGLGKIDTGPEYQQELAAAKQPFKEMGEDFPEYTNPEVDKLVDSFSKPSFRSKSAVQAMRELRNQSKKNLRVYDPSKNALGIAQRKIANALENQIERHLQGTDNEELLNQFRGARTQFAKINTVRDAMSPTTGNIDPQELAKQLKRGVPLSGGLRDIADLATNFPQVMKLAQKTSQWGPYSRIDYLLGGYSVLKHDPLLLAAVASRPVVKHALLSDLYQSRLTGEPGGKAAESVLKTLKAIPEKTPYLLKALPALGAESATGP